MGKSGPSSGLGAHARGWALASLGMWMWTFWACQQAHWACWALFHNLPSSGMIANLNKQLAGIRLVLSNPYDILLEMIQNPEFFGKPFVIPAIITGLTLHDMNDI